MAGKSSIVVTLLLVLIELCHSDQNLINQTCQKTPSPAVCLSSLRSDRRSAAATDVQGLGVIMVDVIKAKATAAQSQIKALLGRNPAPKVKQTLTNCATKYNVLLTALVPSAHEAVTTGAFKFAVDAANGAASIANTCESGFGGKSPISSFNKNTRDVSLVTAAMIRLLL